MAKLADYYSVYWNPSATEFCGPSYSRLGKLQERPTVWMDTLPGRSTFWSSGQPCLSCIVFPAVLWVSDTCRGFMLSSWTRWKLSLFHLALLKRTLQLARWFTPFITEVCSDTLFSEDHFYRWSAVAGNCTRHLHLTEAYRSLPPNSEKDC